MHYTGIAGLGAHGEMHVFNDGYLGLADVGGGVTNVAIVIPGARAHAMRGAPDRFADAWIAAHPSVAGRFTAGFGFKPNSYSIKADRS